MRAQVAARAARLAAAELAAARAAEAAAEAAALRGEDGSGLGGGNLDARSREWLGADAGLGAGAARAGAADAERARLEADAAKRARDARAGREVEAERADAHMGGRARGFDDLGGSGRDFGAPADAASTAPQADVASMAA